MASGIVDFTRQFAPWLTLGLGVLMGGVRAAWSFVYEHTIGYAITKVSLSLTVEDTEHRDAYTWLSYWVETNLRGRKINALLLRARNDEDSVDGASAAGYQVIPEYGTYYLTYAGRLMTVEHRKEQQDHQHSWRSNHSIRLRVWLSRDRELMMDILEQARERYANGRVKRVEYYRWDTYTDWIGTTIPRREINSLFHRPELIHDLFGDVGIFLRAKRMFEDLGIPYRRGYLLTGPPGTGKSSLILAVASHFELPVYSVPLRGAEINGERLTTLLASCRKPSLITLEDVDCLRVATSRESKTDDGLTIADLLNAIDGIGASEDRVLFMTANRPEMLDNALTRAGRVDRKFYVDYARDEELKSFYDRTAQYIPLMPWNEFRAALPLHATIADAQALALSEDCMVESLV
jgi:mitochondrial chaperone BCS1